MITGINADSNIDNDINNKIHCNINDNVIINDANNDAINNDNNNNAIINSNNNYDDGQGNVTAIINTTSCSTSVAITDYTFWRVGDAHSGWFHSCLFIALLIIGKLKQQLYKA